MARFENEKEFIESVEAHLSRVCEPVMLEIEAETTGTDYGAISWSTPAQVDLMIEHLGLDQSSSYLDIGAGSGWPGLYVGSRTGCEVTLVDHPISGLMQAVVRARADGVPTVASSGDAAVLPFRDGTFHGVTHSDVMCCMGRKREALEECRRVTRAGGAMAFTAIQLAPDLAAGARAEGIEAGPEYVEPGSSYASLLDQSGWSDVAAVDVTEEFESMAKSILTARVSRRDRLVDLLGEEDAELSIGRAKGTIEAIGKGLLRRFMYLARAQP